MHQNPFVLPTEQYTRNVDPVGQYMSQAAHYLHIMTGDDPEACKAAVKKMIADKKFPTIRNPQVDYLERQENGDRMKLQTNLSEYIYTSLKNEELIAPTLTTYVNPKVCKAVHVDYVDENVAGRSKAKKEMFVAKAKGDKFLTVFKNQEQTNKKLKNNAVSGAQVSPSTPLNNKTAHSTLTSNCRSTSGYGNANNEKFLSGNRHYWGVDVALNSITSICHNTNLPAIQILIDKYSLYVPSADDVIECIRYSTDFYWQDPKGHVKVRDLVDKLTPLQRTAFVYVGDFYHLAKYNRDVSHAIITGISTKVQEDFPNALEYVNKADEEYVNLARNICLKEMTGKTKIYKEIEGSTELMTLAATVKRIDDTIQLYGDLIAGLWTTDNVPGSVAYFPESIRRSALTSDTDSTIFTVQDWVWWYYGQKRVKAGSPVAAAMIFLASQSIIHVLARMSANFGVEQKRLYEIAMKNEYKFDVFVPTNVAKHYYAIKNVQEGIILDPVEYEIKGVHLKNSNIPKSINERALSMMKRILTTVANAEDIKIMEYLKEIGDLEREIFDKIYRGDSEFLRHGEIKNPESYSKPPDQSPYLNHTLWDEVFGDKYGRYGLPPYACVKLSTTLDNPMKTKAWIDAMEDKDIAQKLTNWMNRTGRKNLPSLMIPADAVRSMGIPKELLEAMGIRKIVSDITKVFYLIMETLGFYMVNDKITRLISDTY